MGKVIPFGNNVKKSDLPPWRFTMDFFQDEEGRWTAEIIAFHPDDMHPAERMRNFSDGLDDIEMKMREKAEDILPGEHGEVIASVKIYRDSMVKVRIDNDAAKKPGMLEWIDERLDDAKEAIRL